MSTIFFEFSSHPRRVFTVTGSFTDWTMALVISTINGTLFSIPAPAPRVTILRTGQPKLMSIKSGRASSTIRAACTIASIKCPYSCMPIGRSPSSISSFLSVLRASRINPSDDTNSVYIMSAPKCLHIKRNEGSVTSSIGARKRGFSPKSISLIRMLGKCLGISACYFGRHLHVNLPQKYTKMNLQPKNNFE